MIKYLKVYDLSLGYKFIITFKTCRTTAMHQCGVALCSVRELWFLTISSLPLDGLIFYYFSRLPIHIYKYKICIVKENQL